MLCAISELDAHAGSTRTVPNTHPHSARSNCQPEVTSAAKALRRSCWTRRRVGTAEYRP